MTVDKKQLLRRRMTWRKGDLELVDLTGSDVITVSIGGVPVELRYRAGQPRDAKGRFSAVGGGGGGSGHLGYSALAEAGREGGFSVTLHGGVPHSGFMVSPYKNAETKIPASSFGREDVHRFRDQHEKLLRKANHYIGAWREGDTVYLDISVRAPDLASAARIARSADQEAVFDLTTGTTVYTSGIAA